VRLIPDAPVVRVDGQAVRDFLFAIVLPAP
jgi:hypothetical protein